MEIEKGNKRINVMGGQMQNVTHREKEEEEE